MKTLIKMTTVLLIPLLYFAVFSGFKSGGISAPAVYTYIEQTPKDFINAIFNCGIEDASHRDRWVTGQIDRYGDELKFNTIQIYDYIDGSNNGTDDYGKFLDDLNGTQMTNVTGLKDMVYGESLKLYWERCKISKLCYGQRLVYEVTPAQGNTTTNNGFCYRNHSGQYTTDSGRTVIYACVPTDNTPRYVSENIYENLQHSDLYSFNLQYADSGTWYMKPMMRIPANTPDDKPVARIVVTNFRGDTISSVILRAMNFKVGGNYNGQYIDKYSFVQGDSLTVSGSDTLASGLGKGIRGYYYWEWPDRCHIDFKVYWLGEVEVWFDKMTVDDKYGNGLFVGQYDYHILDETTPEIFLITALMVKDGDFAESNYEAVNYVMNVMYNKLKYQARPISLK